MLNTEAGKTIRDARERALLTQQELAAKAGVSLWTISDVEGGRNRTPRLRTIYRIAKALNLDPDLLFEASEGAA